MAAGSVLVVGGGVIGMSIAWRAARGGLDVTVVDPAPGSGASWTAAGMLAPATELHPTERDLLRLNVASAQRYPAFVAELEQASGLPVGYRTGGTVLVAWDAGDLAALRDLAVLQSSLGLPTELLTSRELRRREPGLAPSLAGGLFAPDDHSVDNRLLHTALLAAARRSGADIRAGRVAAVDTDIGGGGSGGSGDGDGDAAGRGDGVTDLDPSARVVGVVLDDGTRLRADAVVLAAGAWAGAVGGLTGVLPDLRPVKGQTVRVKATGEPPLRHVLRGAVRGSPIYVVPRADGSLVIGASSEEAGFDLRPRAGAVYELLRDATALLPALAEAEFVEVSTGLRPATSDNAPLLGHASLPGLLLAAGHYRNGVLLAPVTAEGIVALLLGQLPPAEFEAFRPDRLSRLTVPA